MNRRMYRVNEAIREVVSQEIETHLKDPRVGFVTVTGVETTPDLRQAKVFVSVLGDEERRQHTLEALSASHGYLQAQLAERLVLKRTPRLDFVYDETIDRGLHISDLIDREAAEIAELQARGGAGGSDAGQAGDAEEQGEDCGEEPRAAGGTGSGR